MHDKQQKNMTQNLPNRDAVLWIIQPLNTSQKIRDTVFTIAGQNCNDNFGLEKR